MLLELDQFKCFCHLEKKNQYRKDNNEATAGILLATPERLSWEDGSVQEVWTHLQPSVVRYGSVCSLASPPDSTYHFRKGIILWLSCQHCNLKTPKKALLSHLFVAENLKSFFALLCLAYWISYHIWQRSSFLILRLQLSHLFVLFCTDIAVASGGCLPHLESNVFTARRNKTPASLSLTKTPAALATELF